MVQSQKASIILIAVKAPQKTVFFDHLQYCSMERLINSVSMVTRLWNHITLRNPEDGADVFSETSVLTRATQYKVSEDIISCRMASSGMLRGVALVRTDVSEKLSASNISVTRIGELGMLANGVTS
jgi:hypothetical protein